MKLPKAEGNTPKIKICGLSGACDIDYINEAAPDYIGFVFAKSKRQIREEEAMTLRGRVRAGITTVGVFVDAPGEQVLRLVQNGAIDAVQLHGNEPPSYIEAIRRKTECPVIKAFRIGREGYTDDTFRAYGNAGTSSFLFDSGYSETGDCYGGTGRTFDWNLIPQTKLPYFLAGGLNAENIEEAIACVKPYAVDISSGVETNGVKDKDKILEIIRRIRNA